MEDNKLSKNLDLGYEIGENLYKRVMSYAYLFNISAGISAGIAFFIAAVMFFRGNLPFLVVIKCIFGVSLAGTITFLTKLIGSKIAFNKVKKNNEKISGLELVDEYSEDVENVLDIDLTNKKGQNLREKASDSLRIDDMNLQELKLLSEALLLETKANNEVYESGRTLSLNYTDLIKS